MRNVLLSIGVIGWMGLFHVAGATRPEPPDPKSLSHASSALMRAAKVVVDGLHRYSDLDVKGKMAALKTFQDEFYELYRRVDDAYPKAFDDPYEIELLHGVFRNPDRALLEMNPEDREKLQENQARVFNAANKIMKARKTVEALVPHEEAVRSNVIGLLEPRGEPYNEVEKLVSDTQESWNGTGKEDFGTILSSMAKYFVVSDEDLRAIAAVEKKHGKNEKQIKKWGRDLSPEEQVKLAKRTRFLRGIVNAASTSGSTEMLDDVSAKLGYEIKGNEHKVPERFVLQLVIKGYDALLKKQKEQSDETKTIGYLSKLTGLGPRQLSPHHENGGIKANVATKGVRR